MAQLHYIALLLFILCCMIVFGEEGARCVSQAGRGTCKNIYKCPYAINLLEKGIYPETCGSNPFDLLVCCREEKRKVAAASRVRRPGELSKKKCKEYYPEVVYGIFVAGGELSAAKEFPHMAAIGYGKKNNIQWLCGGSLISKNFILTAAHCLNGGSNRAKWVRLGELDFATDKDDASPQDYTIKRRIPHPEYRSPLRYHDIGLIELDREVTLSDYVGIACLDTVRQREDKQMVATGWGNTHFAGEPSTALMKIRLDIKSRAACQTFYGFSAELPNGVIADGQICAGGIIGEDTCQGDSGGPLQVRNYTVGNIIYVYDIIGVTSFGKACGITRTPGIYTRVYNYLSWIESIVWPSE